MTMNDMVAQHVVEQTVKSRSKKWTRSCNGRHFVSRWFNVLLLVANLPKCIKMHQVAY